MIALGYIRRSKESGARTVSLEDQRARIQDYCQERGWSLAEVLADDGVSGGRRERLERLAERVKATGARAIVGKVAVADHHKGQTENTSALG